MPLLHGDIVFAASGETAEEIGKAVAYLGHGAAVVGGDTVVLRGHGQNPSFLAHALNADDAVRQKSRLGKGQSIVHIHAPDLSNVQVWLPPLQEQSHISNILAAWDEAIEKTNRLIDFKRQRIRGILAENVSDARGKAKSNEWEKTTIGDVATLTQQRVTWDEQATYRLITVKRGCGGLVFRGDRKGHEILTKDMYTVRAGDFLISKRQVVHGAWAMVTPEFDGGHVSKEYACLRAKPGKLWMPYFDWLSRTERLQHEAFICSYGVDIEKMVLNVEWLLQTPLLLPRSIETQKDMAAGLDSLQREVDLLKAQMEALRRQKRGLMQKLLTGEWRMPLPDSDVDAMAARVTEEAAQ
ncbi:restriction endonuclease subunit S [Mesorhizobium opportunistum]|uniref:Restriction endonuclease subunit S n=1 Tax=Mesorhizobium opportunistum TaxID=593909 RepID=A0ABV1YA89_9HYPH